MTERKCEGCRFFDKFTGFSNGLCRRMPPSPSSGFPPVESYSSCGEWKDQSITPEQEDKKNLVRLFAVSIANGCYSKGLLNEQIKKSVEVWELAEKFVNNEPGRFNVPK